MTGDIVTAISASDVTVRETHEQLVTPWTPLGGRKASTWWVVGLRTAVRQVRAQSERRHTHCHEAVTEVLHG